MRKIVSGILTSFVIVCYANISSVAEDNLNDKSKETELNAFVGMFDFSDEKQHAGLFGLQHQSDELFRESF